MRKFLLLDADVIIDLHTLGMFGKIKKIYNLFVTRETLREAKYYLKKNKKITINISRQVLIIDHIDLKHLQRGTISSFIKSGYTQRQMVDELNRIGVKTAKGCEFTLITLQRIMKRLGLSTVHSRKAA